MKKTSILLILLFSCLFLNAQWNQWNGISSDWQTQNGVTGISVGTVGADFTPAFQVRGDLMGTGGNAPTGEVFETVGLSSSTNAWRLKTNNSGTITEMFRVLVSSGGVDASLDAVAGKLYLKTIGEEPMIFHTWSSEKMRITSGGFVGIGTNSPASKLHVRGFANSTYLTITNDDNTNGFQFGTATTTGIAEIKQLKNAELQIFTNDGTSTAQRMEIGGLHGNIAIPDGTSDRHKLRVVNSDNVTGATAGDQVGIHTASILDDNIDDSHSIGLIAYAENGYRTEGVCSVVDNVSTTATNVDMRGYYTHIRSTGTTNVDEAWGLDVVFDDETYAVNKYGVEAKVLGWASNMFGIRAISTGQTTGTPVTYAYGGYFEAENATSNYGVYGEATGTTSAFGVYGKAPIQTCVTTPPVPPATQPTTTCAGAAGYFDGDVFATANIYDLSDATFKTQVTEIENAGDILSQIQAKQYVFDNSAHPNLELPSGLHYGFISQDIEGILPNFTKDFQHPAVVDSLGNVVHEGFAIKGLNYIQFIPLLVEAVNDQKEIIDSLLLALNGSSLQNSNNQLNERQGQQVELKDITSIILKQNDPNPFTESTRISFVIPEEVKVAKMIFTNQNGSVINTVDVQERGASELQIFASDLSSGIYTYTLVCDGKVIDSKKMMKK